MRKKRAPLALYHMRDAITDFLAIVREASVEEIAADKRAFMRPNDVSRS